MIDSYSFGEIVVDGRRYTSDVIIYPDRVDGSWWRRQGHQLHIDDIREVIREIPEVLVIGTGDSGLMEVLPQTRNHLESLGIKLFSEATHKACETYNRLCSSKKVVAALHLTC